MKHVWNISFVPKALVGHDHEIGSVDTVTYMGFEYRSVHDGDRRGFTVKPSAKYVDEYGTEEFESA